MIGNEWSDSRLLIALQENNTQAFSLLFGRYSRVLYAFAFRYLKSREDAEDAVQYAFMRLWEQRYALGIDESVRNWLITILRNFILNEIRHKNIVYKQHYAMAQMATEGLVDESSFFEEKDLWQHVGQLIDMLPPQKREICRLKIDRNLSIQEIADEMRISVPTVKSHYTQALKILRREAGKLMPLIIVLLHY